MRNRLLFLFLILLPLQAAAQLKTGGYFSFEYLKGDVQSEFHRGSIENVDAGVTFFGEIPPRLNCSLEFRLKEQGRLEVEEAWLGIAGSETFSLKLGLYLVPFGRYNRQNRPFQNLLVNFPLNLKEVYPRSWRDLGIVVEGKMGSFLYSAYIGNGLAESEDLSSGQQFRDVNGDPGKGGRAGLLLSQTLEVGFSYFSGKYDEEGRRNLTLQGADAIWITEDYYLLSEYTRAVAENPSPFAEGKAEGYFVLLALTFGNFRPLVCYQEIRYEDPFHGFGYTMPDSAGEGISFKKNRWAVGFVYIVSPNILIKMEYDFNREGGARLKDDVFVAQAAVNF